MRLMLIVSLLEERVDAAVAYHAAVNSELRSLEAVAAACNSMAALLLIQAVWRPCPLCPPLPPPCLLRAAHPPPPQDETRAKAAQADIGGALFAVMQSCQEAVFQVGACVDVKATTRNM